mgnify:CR=1 FL=1
MVYPAYGVAEVIRLETRAIGGADHAFYVLSVLGSDVTIMIPTHNADGVGLRPVMAPEQARAVFDVLRKPSTAPEGPWNRRHREYLERLKVGTPEAVATVLRDLLRLQCGKDLSFSERKLLDTARALLINELALATRKPEAAVEREIDRLCRPTRAA